MTLRRCATSPGVKTIELWRNLISTLPIDLIQQCAAGLVALVSLGFGGRLFGQNTQVIHVHGDLHLSGSNRKHESKEWKTYRPLIGILSQGGSPAPEGSSYIASSYVKFVESAGARAVPILHDMSHAEMKRRFKAVNGILIPGGGQDLSPGHPFYDAVKYLLDLTIEENDKGVLFPMHGTCLGFEAIAIAATGNTSILGRFDAEDYAQPLYPTEHAEDSRFFKALPPRVVANLYAKPYAMQNHMNGIAFSAFAENPRLDDFFQVLTLSIDRQKKVYVSTMEAKDYPISATQWHPEKNAFEWTRDEDIPHHPDAIEVTQEVANSFVDLARMNSHAPRSRDEEEELLIYNYSKDIVYSGKHLRPGEEVNFDQIYVFPDASP